jgi:hypothetical protein
MQMFGSVSSNPPFGDHRGFDAERFEALQRLFWLSVFSVMVFPLFCRLWSRLSRPWQGSTSRQDGGRKENRTPRPALFLRSLARLLHPDSQDAYVRNDRTKHMGKAEMQASKGRREKVYNV